MSDLREFLWIAVLGGIAGFAYGFLIGANDVANAFASSVSSKSITLKQAVIIASVFEFSGAFFLGASVTGTIRSKIVSTSLYDDEPEVLMLGMFTSLFSAVLMLFLATHFGLPVSTTHDIVGCIMGFSIAAKGFDSIEWDVARKIFVSWIVSPVFSGGIAAVFFGTIKYLVLRAKNPYERAFYTFPVVLVCGVGLNVFYVLYKATNNKSSFQSKLELSSTLPISFGSGAFCALVWIFIIGPVAKKRVEAHLVKVNKPGEVADDAVKDVPELDDGNIEPTLVEGEQAEGSDKATKVEELHTPQEQAVPLKTGLLGTLDRFAKATYDQDLHAQSMQENMRASQIWDDGEKFDENAEGLFTYTQVFTACLNSFAHGANDVSNTIAPLSAIIHIYRDGVVESKSEVQKWVLAYGGTAIVLGLLLYGYKVIKSIGYKLTLMTPSRGFSAELAASMVVVTASFNEIPVSSTQCIVGAVSGVGLVGGFKNVQWLFLLRVMFSWVFLFFAASLLSAGVFSFAAYSPSLV